MSGIEESEDDLELFDDIFRDRYLVESELNEFYGSDSDDDFTNLIEEEEND